MNTASSARGNFPHLAANPCADCELPGRVRRKIGTGGRDCALCRPLDFETWAPVAALCFAATPAIVCLISVVVFAIVAVTVVLVIVVPPVVALMVVIPPVTVLHTSSFAFPIPVVEPFSIVARPDPPGALIRRATPIPFMPAIMAADGIPIAPNPGEFRGGLRRKYSPDARFGRPANPDTDHYLGPKGNAD